MDAPSDLDAPLVGKDDAQENFADPPRNTPPPLKSDSLWRWVVLSMSCLAMIGNYYCFDNPAALKTQMEEYAGIDETEFNMLYTVYSIPNIILPFFGGYLCDMLGASFAFSLFAAALVAGQAVFAFGMSLKSVPIMYIGRVIYGLGGENMAVGASVILEEWFRNKEMALAMALNVAVSRVGSVINNILSPTVADATNVPVALWLGAVICCGSLACTMIILPVDRAAARRVRAEETARRLLVGGDEGSREGGSFSESPLFAGVDNDNTSSSSSKAVVDDGLAGEATRMRTRSASSAADGHGEPYLDGDGEQEARSTNPLAGCKDVSKFGRSFWLLTVCCVVVYGCVIPFNSVASSLLMERDFFVPQPHGSCALMHPNLCPNATNVARGPADGGTCETHHKYQPPLKASIDADDVVCTDKDWTQATGPTCAKEYCKAEKKAEGKVATVFSIPYFMSAFLSPILGGGVDKVGGRAVICLGSGLMLVAVHGLLGFSSVNPVVPMVGQGMAYSMFAAALWPSVPYLVPKESVGIAYGVVTAVQNMGLAGIPLIVAMVYNASGETYIPYVELLFVCFAIGGSFCALALNCTAPQLNMVDPPPYEDLKDGNTADDEASDDIDSKEWLGPSS